MTKAGVRCIFGRRELERNVTKATEEAVRGYQVTEVVCFEELRVFYCQATMLVKPERHRITYFTTPLNARAVE